jgi:signal transduction histidine kinase
MSVGQVVRPPWIRVTAAAGGPAAEPPVKPRRVWGQVIVAALVVLLAVGLVGVVAARRLAEAEAVNDASTTANLLAETVVQPAATEDLRTSQPAAVAAMDRVIRQHVLGLSLVRVKIWDAEGRIVYSDAPGLIGQHYPLGDEERDVLVHPQVRADVSDLQAPENRLERGRGKLLEVYRPIWTPSGTPLLFETYAPYDTVTARTGQLWKGFAGVTLTSQLLLVVLLIPILLRLLERLKCAQAQREALLRRTVDASTEERRRIAGALHDGVVQDLAAASFTVAGAAARADSLHQPGLAVDLRAAEETVRASIGGLRSLLVDIYPPSLASAGLEAALADLTSSLRSRGTVVVLSVTPKPGLDSAGERLLFRVAQECLRNIAQHASATTVQVTLEKAEGFTMLEITDDGVGFYADRVLAEPPEGHFGLRVLADVVSDAGAELRVASAPGLGTAWQLRVPR